MYGHRIEVVNRFIYLGIMMDPQQSYVDHVKHACAKARRLIWVLAKKVRSSWDLDVAQAMRTIFWGAVLSIVAYDAEIWHHRIPISKVRQQLLSLHGLCSRIVIRGYVSVSNDAAAVLASIPPLDLLIERRVCLSSARRGQAATFLGTPIHPHDFADRRHLREHIEGLVLQIWQDCWDASTKGRTTHLFSPRVTMEITRPLNFSTTQLLTGHGEFRAHLHRVGKDFSDECLHCPGASDDPPRICNCPT